MPNDDRIPRAIRRLFYALTVALGGVLFVLMALNGSGLVESGDVLDKWIAFLTALTAAPAGGMGLAYSRTPGEPEPGGE